MKRNIVCSMHKMHCMAACQLKLHTENGKVVNITSDGDIPRAGSYDFDESIYPIQRRACMRGYGELYRMYQPNRILYPMLQTRERGNLAGFKRISWKEAFDRYLHYYEQMLEESKKYGYLPVVDIGGVGNQLGVCLYPFGSSSCGNVDAAIIAAIGKRNSIHANTPIDMFNTKYLIFWSSNPAETLPYLQFVIEKAKESKISITVVDTRYTETADTYATGKGKVPGYIHINPGTDGALMAAMAYIIYKRKLHDDTFIKKYCFGFYKNDEVNSKSPAYHPVTNEPYKGKHYKVPDGESFVEYLEDLEKEHGSYQKVLSWASKVTGIRSEIIENFAIEYATSSPSFIFSRFHGGAQRMYTGFYYSWMMIALSAMTGNINKRGGGFGELRGDDGFSVEMLAFPGYFINKPIQPILISQYGIDQVILTGTDGRKIEDLNEDICRMNNLDIGDGLRIRGLIKGAANGNPFNQLANVNKRRIAWNQLDFVVTYERQMTPTAQWSDLILPVKFPLEEGRRFDKNGALESDVNILNGIYDAPAEVKSDEEINIEMARRLGISVRINDYEQLMKEQWAKAYVSDDYVKPEGFQLPDYDEICKSAHLSIPVKPEDTPIVLSKFEPGYFETETGKINFYSPFLAERNRTSHKINRAQYVPLEDGFETTRLYGGFRGHSGRKYTLQFITPHAATRANSDFANIPILQETERHCIFINPEDAQERDLQDQDMAFMYTEVGCIYLPVKCTYSIPKGLVAVKQGAWYKPDKHMTFYAWLECNGEIEKCETPVDIGGCVNTLTRDLNSGIHDPFINGMGFNANGSACEVSKSLPDK